MVCANDVYCAVTYSAFVMHVPPKHYFFKHEKQNTAYCKRNTVRRVIGIKLHVNKKYNPNEEG